MRRAKLTVAAFMVQCPACRQPVSEPQSGSQLWDMDWNYPKEMKCVDCGTEFSVSVPKTMRVD